MRGPATVLLALSAAGVVALVSCGAGTGGVIAAITGDDRGGAPRTESLTLVVPAQERARGGDASIAYDVNGPVGQAGTLDIRAARIELDDDRQPKDSGGDFVIANASTWEQQPLILERERLTIPADGSENGRGTLSGRFEWDYGGFLQENPGQLPSDTASFQRNDYRDDVAVRLELADGVGRSRILIGNDAPEIRLEVGSEETVRSDFGDGPSRDGLPVRSELVEVRVGFWDSSTDDLAVRVEYRPLAADGEATDEWRHATLVGRRVDVRTGQRTRTNLGLVVPQSDGGEVSLFWQSSTDVVSSDGLFELRIRGWDLEDDDGGQVRRADSRLVGSPVDRASAAEDGQLFRTREDAIRRGVDERWFSLGLVFINNNREPVSSIDGSNIGANPDRRRGIPIAFTVFDDENDAILPVFQWFEDADDAASKPLPRSLDAVLELLADPVQRQEFRVARPAIAPFGGRLESSGDALFEARLPELAGRESAVLRGGGGRRVPSELTLDVLRRGTSPTVTTWAGARQASGVVGVVPIDDGRHAYVLETVGGGWRLTRRHLETGALQLLVEGEAQTEVLGPGNPTVLAQASDTLLTVATATDRTDALSTWSLVEVDVTGGSARTLASSSQFAGLPFAAGPVRDVEWLGAGQCVLTVSDSLVRLYTDRNGLVDRGHEVCRLESPWGLAVDPAFGVRQVYVAERTAGRIVRVDLRTATRTVVGLGADDAEEGRDDALDAPTALTLDASGRRLLAWTTNAGLQQLVAIQLGEVFDPDQDGAPISLHTLWTPGFMGTASVGTGARGLCVVTLYDGDDVLGIAGGVEQSRRLSDDTTWRHATVRVDVPFDPALDGSRALDWTLRGPDLPAFLFGSPGGPTTLDGLFLWDSAQAASAGRAILRLTPYDQEAGTPSVMVASKEVLHPLETAPLVLGGAPAENCQAVAVLDRDGDGDPDVVTIQRDDDVVGGQAVAHTLTQDSGLFDSDGSPLVLDGLQSGRWTEAADLNDDGRTDLVVSGLSEGGPRLLFAEEDGTWSPLRLAGGSASGTARAFGLGALGGTLDVHGRDLLDVAVARDGEGGGDGAVELYFQGIVDIDVGHGFLEGQLPSATLRHPFGPTYLPMAVAVADLVKPDSAGSATTATSLDGLSDLVVVSAHASDPDRGLVTVWYQPVGGFVDNGDGLGGIDEDAVDRLDLSFGALGPEGWPSPEQIHLGDIDGNGLLDLVLGGGTPELWLVLQDRTRFLKVVSVDIGGDGIARPQQIDSADFDEDGRRDLLTSGREGVGLAALIQEPDSVVDLEAGLVDLRFRAVRLRSDRARGLETNGVQDLDGDGRPDVFGAGESDDRLVIFQQSPPGLFDREPSAVLSHPSLEKPSRVLFGDLSGNGLLDVVVVNSMEPQVERLGADDPDTLLIQWQVRPGLFDDQPTELVPPVNEGRERSERASIGAVDISDVDGDTWPDLILVTRETVQNGVVVPATLCVAFAVIDAQKGRVVDYDMHELARSHASLDIRDAETLSIGDWSGDGRVDLAIGSQATQTLFLLRGPFSPGQSIDVPDATVALDAPFLVASAAADVDSDGRLDFVIASRRAPGGDGGTVTWLRSQGGGAFTVESLLPGDPETFDPTDVEVADIDGDGRMDVAVTSYELDSGPETPRVVLFLQQADASFEARDVLTDDPSETMNRPRALELVDTDRDGDLDLVVTCGHLPTEEDPNLTRVTSKNVVVLPQIAPGIFRARNLLTRTVVSNGIWTGTLAVGDVDGDGEVDFAVADHLLDVVIVYYGSR